MIKVKHEADDTPTRFRHRLVVVDTVDGTVLAEGKWTRYRALAQVRYDGKEYRGATSFFDGDLPVEKVFEVKVV